MSATTTIEAFLLPSLVGYPAHVNVRAVISSRPCG